MILCTVFNELGIELVTKEEKETINFLNMEIVEQGKDTSVDEEAQREEDIDFIEQKDSCAETDSENCGQDCSICLQGLGKLIRGEGIGISYTLLQLSF